MQNVKEMFSLQGECNIVCFIGVVNEKSHYFPHLYANQVVQMVFDCIIFQDKTWFILPFVIIHEKKKTPPPYNFVFKVVG